MRRVDGGKAMLDGNGVELEVVMYHKLELAANR